MRREVKRRRRGEKRRREKRKGKKGIKMNQSLIRKCKVEVFAA